MLRWNDATVEKQTLIKHSLEKSGLYFQMPETAGDTDRLI